MSRITHKQDIKSPEIKKMMEVASEKMGFISNDILIMAHQPEMLKASAGLIHSVLHDGSVDPGLKRLIGYIVSTSSGCMYCSAHTNYTARFYNVDESKIREAWNFENSTLFSSSEKAALRLAHHSSMTPNGSTKEDFENIKNYYSDDEVVEIVFTISLYAFLNRFNSTMKTDLEKEPSDLFAQLNVVNGS